MNQSTLNNIKTQIQGSKEIYLQNCRNNYSEYVAAAQILFPEYYGSNERQKHHFLVEESIKSKKIGDQKSELNFLEKAVFYEIDIPYVYNRLAIIYTKNKELEKARGVCQKWFNSIYWKIPNMSATSLKLLKRLEKLNSKLIN